MPIIVKKFSVEPMDNNIYVIFDKNKNGFIIDAPENIDDVLVFLEEEKINIEYILLTHGHYDHIAGLDILKNATNAKIVISKGCQYMLESEEYSLGEFSPYFVQPISKEDFLVDDGDVLDIFDFKVKVHIVSGHTKGDTVYEVENYLFTGDTLFAGDIGRGDLPGGDLEKLIKNIKNLSLLGDHYKVCPGHGPDSTIAHEKRYNKYIG